MLNISKDGVEDLLEKKEQQIIDTLTPKKTATQLSWIILILLGSIILILLLPWQQNIGGYGKVTALAPENRPQTIETTIAGRIEKWYIREGQEVKRGDTIMTISEIKDKFFDPEILIRLGEQKTAKENAIVAKERKISALHNQVEALTTSLSVKLDQAENKINQQEFKVKSDSADYAAEESNFLIAEKQFVRFEELWKNGLKSQTDYENKKLKYQESKAKLVSSENKYLTSKSELLNYLININSIKAEYLDKISKAESFIETTRSEILESRAVLAKITNEISNIRVRTEQYDIRAPQNGYVVKALKAGVGQTIKEGEAVVTIFPISDDKAAEMYVNAIDVPLIKKGTHVRLEFEGWPVFQVSGWPGSGVGTYGGIVEVKDYVNDKNGLFRVLIVPDPEEEPWPDELRIGMSVQGWALLNRVPLYYEVWRQLNSFPPAYTDEEEEEKKKKKKRIKLK